LPGGLLVSVVRKRDRCLHTKSITRYYRAEAPDATGPQLALSCRREGPQQARGRGGAVASRPRLASAGEPVKAVRAARVTAPYRPERYGAEGGNS
jgi:hypothetical protein